MENQSSSIPQIIGPYEVIRRIGEGGMAEVFLGRRSGGFGFEKLVAIKRIHPSFVKDSELIAMFVDEARISATLSHSNIGQVFEFGQVDNTFFLAMEYVHGVNLRQVLDDMAAREMVLQPAMAAYLVGQVCIALDYIHAKSDSRGVPLHIVHRDVNPANIMLSFEGDVKLVDFGVVRASQRVTRTRHGVIKGKVDYMAPEQAVAGAIDHRVDIFGAGVTLYELLTGFNPIAFAHTPISVCKKLEQGAILPSRYNPQVPAALDAVCQRAMAIAPKDRYQQAGDMQAELEAICTAHAFGRRQLHTFINGAYQATDPLQPQAEQDRQFRGTPEGSSYTLKRPADQGGDQGLALVDTSAATNRFEAGTAPTRELKPPKHAPTIPSGAPLAEQPTDIDLFERRWGDDDSSVIPPEDGGEADD